MPALPRPALLALLLAFVVPAAAHARPEVTPRAVDPQLAELPLAKNRAALAAWLKARFERRYLPIIAAAPEFAEKERLRAQREREVAEVLQGEVPFEEAHTVWDVSIIAGEFVPLNGESVIVWRDEGATHFFFLIGGTFWKYARQLDPGEPFAARLAAWTERHGAPEARPSEVEAVWRGAGVTLRLVDRRVLYGGDLAIIESAELARGVAHKRQETAHKRQSSKRQDTSLDDFLLPDDER